MFTYVQSTGELYDGDTLLGKGYAGTGEGRNNPAMQHVRMVGPLPCGKYEIRDPLKRHLKAGVFVIPLIPFETNEMFGRSGFLIHGDNRKNDASNGCIIMPRPVRALVASKGGELLVVKSRVENGVVS